MLHDAMVLNEERAFLNSAKALPRQTVIEYHPAESIFSNPLAGCGTSHVYLIARDQPHLETLRWHSSLAGCVRISSGWRHSCAYGAQRRRKIDAGENSRRLCAARLWRDQGGRKDTFGRSSPGARRRDRGDLSRPQSVSQT